MELTQDDVVRILRLIDESPMGRVSLQIGELRLEVVKGENAGTAGSAPRPAGPGKSEAAVRKEPEPKQPPEPKPAQALEPGLLTIKAPLLGTFYRRPQPGSPPYVEEGSLVDEETTVALIEVMKLFNAVRAGVKGRIHKIVANDNEFVEYGQVLFLLKPE